MKRCEDETMLLKNQKTYQPINQLPIQLIN